MVKEFSMTPRERAENWKLFEKSYDNKHRIKKLLEILDKTVCKDDDERNDVHIYKTLRYPPKSTPPNPN